MVCSLTLTLSIISTSLILFLFHGDFVLHNGMHNAFDKTESKA